MSSKNGKTFEKGQMKKFDCDEQLK